MYALIYGDEVWGLYETKKIAYSYFVRNLYLRYGENNKDFSRARWLFNKKRYDLLQKIFSDIYEFYVDEIPNISTLATFPQKGNK